MTETQRVTMDHLRADLAAVMRDAETLLKASADQGGEKVEAARTKIRESMQGAKARLQEAQAAAVRHGEEAIAATEDRIRSNPWQSVGIAAAAGLVVGVLLTRR
jgi:ElaB/YqjD/DUF883 family membrane-anchored ribosome-binding protein